MAGMLLTCAFACPQTLWFLPVEKKSKQESKRWVQKGKAGCPGQAGRCHRDCAHEPASLLMWEVGEEKTQVASLSVLASGEGVFALGLLAGAGVSPAVRS